MAKKSAGENHSSEVITTSTGTLWLDADGIFRGESLPGIEETLSSAQEIIAGYEERLAQGKVRPMLIDIRAIKSVTREAREYFGSPEATKYTNRLALLIASPVSRLIGTFALRFSKSNHPVRLFTSQSEALEWLKEGIE